MLVSVMDRKEEMEATGIVDQFWWWCRREGGDDDLAHQRCLEGGDAEIQAPPPQIPMGSHRSTEGVVVEGEFNGRGGGGGLGRLRFGGEQVMWWL